MSGAVVHWRAWMVGQSAALAVDFFRMIRFSRRRSRGACVFQLKENAPRPECLFLNPSLALRRPAVDVAFRCHLEANPARV